MSELGWKRFLTAEGVGYWVVLHGGATAVFRIGSLRQAASLAADLAEIRGLETVVHCLPSRMIDSQSA
jgi:4a-hydroxytetrahydrobiopterin dehydratase